MGFPSENVSTLKQRIELLQGIPVVSIRLFTEQNGELKNSDSIFELSEQESIFMTVDEIEEIHKFSFNVKSDHDKNHYDLPVDIQCHFITNRPVTLGMYREYNEKLLGLKYNLDFDVKVDGRTLLDDTHIIDDSVNEGVVSDFYFKSFLENIKKHELNQMQD